MNSSDTILVHIFLPTQFQAKEKLKGNQQIGRMSSSGIAAAVVGHTIATSIHDIIDATTKKRRKN